MISKKDFPLFGKHKDLIYLDNAATTHKPQVMVDALQEYYVNSNSNVGRGAYELANLSELLYQKSKNAIMDFFNPDGDRYVLSFTSGATESLNAATFMASENLKDGDVILLTIWDHHSNILPWQRIAKEKNLIIKFIENIDDIYNPENLPQIFWDKVKVLAMPHVPNTTGNIFPIKKWTQEASKRGVITIIDGSQSVSSMKVDMKELDADFYAFSAHKIYGPMGLGCLFIKKERTTSNRPFLLGGGIVENVDKNQYSLKEASEIFDAGTPNVANIYAFAETLVWLSTNDWVNSLSLIKSYNQNLINFVNQNKDIELLTDISYPHTAITTIQFKNIHSHDVGTFLSERNIAVRVGKHCAYPLHQYLDKKHSVRFSLGVYNTQEEIETVKKAIEDAITYFG